MSNVIHIASNYSPRLGGLEKVVEELATTQYESGMDVRVITSKLGFTPGYTDKIPVKRLAAFEIANTPLMPSLFWHLLKIKKTDIAHIHVAQAYMPEMVMLVSKLKKFSYIAHVHLDIAPSGKAGILLKLYKPLVLKRVLQRAKYVIVFSEEQKIVILKQYDLKDAQVVIVPNGVAKKFYYTQPRRLHEKPRLLFVGRLSVQKNVRQLLEALDGISEKFETHIVGDGDLRVVLEKQAATLGLENVYFDGRKDGDALKKAYRSSDIFVLPSEREGMPLVLLEAMAMGLPIVGTNVTGIKDLIEDNGTGILVELNDAQGMQDALITIINNKYIFESMSKKACNEATSYSWDKVVRAFDDLYERDTNK